MNNKDQTWGCLGGLAGEVQRPKFNSRAQKGQVWGRLLVPGMGQWRQVDSLGSLTVSQKPVAPDEGHPR